MPPVQHVKYEKLEAGMHDLENVVLNEQQIEGAPRCLLWQQHTPLTKLGFAVRCVLGFVFVLTLLNIGFLLGDRLVGTTCDAGKSAATSSVDIIWSKFNRRKCCTGG
jgi:hypothetical protein